MKKKSHYNAESNVDLLYDTQTGLVVKNKNEHWVKDERAVKPALPLEPYEIFDIWNLNSPHALLAVTNYGDYRRSIWKVAKRTVRVFGGAEVYLLYYTAPRSTIYELDLIQILQNGLSHVLLGEDPPAVGTSLFVDGYVIDEFKPLDNDYVSDGVEILDYAAEKLFSGNYLPAYVPLYPRVYSKDQGISLKNNTQNFGAPIFYENSAEPAFLNPKKYRDVAVCNYFVANRSAEHIGLGKLIVNVYFSLIGESLRGLSIGGSLFWGGLVYSNTSLSLEFSPLYSYNFNAGGLEYIGRKYEFNDCSVAQYYGSELSIFDNSRHRDKMLQFRWNYWNNGSGFGEYPEIDGSPLKAMDKSSELRNFPDFPRQANYNIPGTWTPSEANVTKGSGSYPLFFLNATQLSFSNKDEVQTLKIFAAKACTIFLDLLGETLINNYAASPVRSFDTETFFIWSSAGPYTLVPGEIREINISVAPLIKNPTNTLKSNRYYGSYVLRVGDFDDEFGQLLSFEMTYLPQYSLNTFQLKYCNTNAFHIRRIYAENLNYIISDREVRLEFEVKSSGNFSSVTAELERKVGDFFLELPIVVIENAPEKKFALQLRAELEKESIGYLVLNVKVNFGGVLKTKKYSFQVLPQRSLISNDFVSLSYLCVFNENDIYIYFEKNNNEVIENIPIRSFGNYVEIIFEDGYDDFFDVNFINNSISPTGEIVNTTTTSFLELSRKPGLREVDFFVRGWIFNRKIVVAGVEVGTNAKIPFYVSNFYPCHNNFKPLEILQ